jgi:hypothetical protein
MIRGIPGNLSLSYGGAYQRPDCIGKGNVANPRMSSMFNLGAFNPIASGPVGNCGVGTIEDISPERTDTPST